MTIEQLIQAIRAIEDEGVRLGAIEKELNMPRNNLSGYLNGKRNFPDKWQRKLTAYVEAKMKRSAIGEMIAMAESPADHTAPISQALPSKKSPPPGLDKAATLKWHRLNSQTLQ